MGGEETRHVVRRLVVSQQLAQGACRGQGEEGEGTELQGFLDDPGEVPYFQRPVVEEADNHGVHRGEGRSLSGGVPAGGDAAHDDHGGEQGGKGFFEKLPYFTGSGFFVLWEVAPVPHEVHDEHHGQSHEDAGDHAAEKEGRHGGVSQAGVDHHGDARRDDDPYCGGRGGDAHGVFLVVARLDHGGDEHLAHSGGVRLGRARDAGEDHGDEDIGVGQAAPDISHKGDAEIHQFLGDFPVVHEVCREDEKRDGQQDEGVESVEHLHEHGEVGDEGNGGNACQGDNPDDEGDGDAEENEEHEKADDEQGRHDAASPEVRILMSSTMCPAR
ncbi:hypothetical protein SDC9_96264 [bioreactor metagenome]|uniref:Uncharacterized protein n=1 Tax=bioreactor metagenome TaxID=1076179 RepID=A0A645AIQ2_9ZZZZ